MGIGILLVWLAGCGGGSSISNGNSSVPPVTMLIGGGGGKVIAGNATLSIPTSAVSQTTSFSVQPTTQYPTDTRIVSGTAYVFTSNATSLLQSVQISIRYNAALLKSGVTESGLRLFQVSGGIWTQVSGSTIDTNNKIVTGTTSSLGIFAVLATVGGGTGVVVSPTNIMYLSDVQGQASINGTVALGLFIAPLGSTNSLQISTFGQVPGQISETITHANFSPDGKTIIYDSQSGSGYLLVLAGANGTNPQVILTGAALANGTVSFPRAPSFSADGTKIVFVYNQTGSDQIYTIKPDGTGITQLTKNFTGTAVDNPAYTKAGNIRFTSTGKSGALQYNLMNADGSNLTSTSTFSPAVAGRYVYSPDGTKIVYTAQASGKSDVFLINADGSNATQLTKLAAATIGKVRFSADSAKVIFDVAQTSSSIRTLYSINVDGTGLQALTVATSAANNYLQDAH